MLSKAEKAEQSGDIKSALIPYYEAALKVNAFGFKDIESATSRNIVPVQSKKAEKVPTNSIQTGEAGSE